MRRRIGFGIVLVLSLLCSLTMFFGVEVPDVTALTLFSHDFADGTGWHMINGVWTVFGGVLRGTSAADAEALIWAGDATWMNYAVTANVRVVSKEASLVVRYTDAANFYFMGVGLWGHKYSISRVVNGAYQELASSGLASEVEVGRWYTVSAVAVDSTLELLVDGVKVLEVPDWSHPMGAVGFRIWGGIMEAAHLTVQSRWSRQYLYDQIFPGYLETSEYLIGSVAVGVIFLESDGTIDASTENWSSYRESQVISEIQSGLSWLANYEPNAHVSFTYDIHYKVPTRYEPINRPHTDQNLWTSEAMTSLGYPGTSSFTQVGDYINDLRVNLDTDWSFAIFVIDSLNDPDGCFTDEREDGRGKYSAYAEGGGPCFVMPYDSARASVTAHETCHIFYATDEYNGKTETRGYLAVQDLEGSGCMMEKSGSLWLCTNSKEQLGWRDSDGDGVQDIVDTFPDTVLYPSSLDPTNQSVLTYSGFVSEIPYPNSNPRGMGRNITINTITNVEFRVDGGPWQSATARDGVFDHAKENFTFTTSLSEGTHLVETRGENSVGNVELTYASDTITVDVSSPTTQFSLSGTLGNNEWFTSNVVVSLSATDSISGVDKTEYSFDNVRWTSYATPFTINQEGETVVYYKSTDQVGNVEPVKIQTVKIDKTVPVGLITINNDATYTTSTAVTLTVTTTDATSGIVEMRFSNDNGTWSRWEPYSISKSWILQHGDGMKGVTVQYRDDAGLISFNSDSIILDTTKPVANAGRDQSVKVGTLVSFDANASADDLGIISYDWSFGDGTTGTGETITHAYTNPGAYTLMLTVEDAAGNTATHQITVTVQSAEAASQMGIPTYLWILLGLVILIFGAAIVAVVLGRK